MRSAVRFPHSTCHSRLTSLPAGTFHPAFSTQSGNATDSKHAPLLQSRRRLMQPLFLEAEKALQGLPAPSRVKTGNHIKTAAKGA